LKTLRSEASDPKIARNATSKPARFAKNGSILHVCRAAGETMRKQQDIPEAT